VKERKREGKKDGALRDIMKERIRKNEELSKERGTKKGGSMF